MSLVLRELDERLPLTAAVAICDALPVEAAIKWPNDVWIEGRKVAGILVEGRPQEGWAVLGIGLNVTTAAVPAELAEIRHVAAPCGRRRDSRAGSRRPRRLALPLARRPPASVLEAGARGMR